MAGMNLRSNARFPTRRLPAERRLPRTDEIGVYAAFLQKFLMRAALHNPSLRDDDNLLRVPHGVEPMCDHDDRLAFRQRFHRLFIFNASSMAITILCPDMRVP